ncbi:Noc2p family-domain-containing protein [Geopyxis carbonaria]|nr:Noc2p family-domain-containing protein [Geopyxis carbonaria]
MGRVKKSTRKFESKHLTRTLDDRKSKAKLKQQFQLREKKKKKKQQDREDGAGSDKEDADKKTKKSKSGELEVFEDMSVEQFFQGGFEIPEVKGKVGKTKTAKRKANQEEQQPADSDGSDGPDGSNDESASEDELDKHKGDLSALAEKDPEFYKYLKDNDPELLDFSIAEKDDLADVDDLSEGEETTGKKNKKGHAVDDTAEVTMADVKKWKAAMEETHSLRALRQVVLAFRAAAHGNDSEEDASQGGYKYSITNPDVYHELVLITLKNVPEVLNHHLPIKESQSGKIRVSTETKKYRTLTPLLKSHSASLLHLLPMLTDAPTQKLLLNSTLSLVPYFLTFRKFLKSFLKAVVEIWSSNSTDEATRITAFLVVRKATVIGDEGMKEMCFKALYAGFVRASRQTMVHTVQGINLMKNSAAEVVGLAGMEKVGYQSGFGYIRQLAIHLRKSITNNSKESYKTVYNWQYVHSLDFWSRVLAMHCDGLKEAQAGKESPLRPLIYPLVQVTLGAIRLIPTAQYFPLRFFLIRSLLRLSLATGAYIPLAPLIYEVLTSAEIKKKPKPSTLKPLDFAITIRAPKSYLRTRTYQDGLGEQVVELFSEFYVLYSKSVAFPELAIPTIVQVKRFMKKSKNAKLNSTLHLLVNKLDQNSKFIEEKRSKIDFAPNKREQVDSFLKDVEWETTPLGAYVTSQRKVREEKQKLLEESLREAKEREQKDRDAEEEMEIDSEDDEEEEDDDDDDIMDDDE